MTIPTSNTIVAIPIAAAMLVVIVVVAVLEVDYAKAGLVLAYDRPPRFSWYQIRC